jgi:hypothetical protein
MKSIQRRQNKILSISRWPKPPSRQKTSQPSKRKYITLIHQQGKGKFQNFPALKGTKQGGV